MPYWMKPTLNDEDREVEALKLRAEEVKKARDCGCLYLLSPVSKAVQEAGREK